MKILFLDVDGVLVHDGTVARANATREPWDSSFYQAARVDPDCVKRVLRIVNETGAKIVITSAWRDVAFQMNGLHRAFAAAGGLNGRSVRELIVGHTPRIHEDRAVEISTWLEQHPDVKQHVAIDDQPLRYPVQAVPLPDTFTGGLQDATVESAIRVLNSPWPVEVVP